MVKSTGKKRKRNSAPRTGSTDGPGEEHKELLSPELQEELGLGGSGQDVIITISKAGKSEETGAKRKLDGRGRPMEDEVLEDAKKMSKRQKKRMVQIQERKAKEARRAALYQTLEEQKMSDEHLKLLRSTKDYTQKKESLKNRLARALEMHRAGLPITDKQAEELLFREIEVGNMPPLPVPPTPAVIPPPTTEATVEGEKGKVKSDGAEAETAQKRRESRRNTKARRRQRKAQEAAAKGGKRRRDESSSEDDEGSSDDDEEEEERKGKADEGPAGMDVSGPEDKVMAGTVSDGKQPEEEHAEEEQQEDADMEEEDEEEESGEEGEEGEDEEDEDGEEGSKSGSSSSSSEEDDEEGDEEGMDVVVEGEKAVPPTAKGAAGGGFGAMMMAQLAKLKEQKPVQPSSGPEAGGGKKPFSLSGRCTVPGLEALDWATILDALCSSDGPEGEGGAPKGPKYVPRQLELITPGMARLKGKLLDEDQGDKKKVKRDRPERHVRVERREEIQAVRMQLPVCGMEQEIVEAVLENHVIVLCGETGSGKSTQVPQFLYEFGYAREGMIGVTQPRRVAAVSTAMRVADEMNTKCGRGGSVAYQIRYDSRGVTQDTRIKFMTDGILLQEVGLDLLLRQYSVVLLDEAHERNLNTDVLLGLLSRAIPLRAEMAREEQLAYDALSPEAKQSAPPPLKPLKLVIMSATLRVEDFTANSRLFPTPPPVIRVDARQFPVSIHFNRRTVMDSYMDEVFRKVAKLHRRLPPGGVLVFLTGKAEILHLCQRLKDHFNKKPKKKGPSAREAHDAQAGEGDEKAGGKEQDESAPLIRELDDDEEEAGVWDGEADDYDKQEAEAQRREDDTEDEDEGSEEEGEKKEEAGEGEAEDEVGPVHVLPLYAMLQPHEQARVFRPPPENHRLIVVSTNVAETSVTIPNIKYVVDSGRVKARVFDHRSGISQYKVQWISQASADQRAGRAGRTGPGHCYRLYSSAVFSQRLEKFTDPEVLLLPLEDVVLQMRAMGIASVERFPFPTAPEPKALQAALALLSAVGATDRHGNLTPLGQAMSAFPVGVRSAKMLLLGKQTGRMDLVVAMVASLTERDPLVLPGPEAPQSKDEGTDETGEAVDAEELMLLKQKAAALKLDKYRQWKHGASDALGRLRAVGAYTYVVGSAGGGARAGAEFSRENMLHGPTLARVQELRKQLSRLINRRFSAKTGHEALHVLPSMPPPSSEEEVLLRQAILGGYLDCVARLAPVGTVATGSRIQRQCAYLSSNPSISEPLYIHPHSSLFSPDPARLPDFVVYQALVRNAKGLPYMTCVTQIEPDWLPGLASTSPLLSFGPPLTSPPPTYDRAKDSVMVYCTPKYGVHNWELRAYPIPAGDLERLCGRTSAGGTSFKELGARWFARLLLEGKVFKGLAEFHVSKEHGTCHNDPPAFITLKRPVRKVFEIVQPLQDRGITTRKGLLQELRRDPTFLRDALKMWIKAEHASKFRAVWQGIVTKAASQGGAVKSSAK